MSTIIVNVPGETYKKLEALKDPSVTMDNFCSGIIASVVKNMPEPCEAGSILPGTFCLMLSLW